MNALRKLIPQTQGLKTSPTQLRVDDKVITDPKALVSRGHADRVQFPNLAFYCFFSAFSPLFLQEIRLSSITKSSIKCKPNCRIGVMVALVSRGHADRVQFPNLAFYLFFSKFFSAFLQEVQLSSITRTVY
eukprot:g2820.t1